MPKLVLYAPCERVILGQGDNSASLIIVLQQMQFHGTLKQGEQVNKGMAAFVHFAVFSQWHKTPGDEGKIFEQRVILVKAGEPIALEFVAEFEMKDRLHRLIANVQVMPMMNQGEYNLQTFVRQKGSRDWGDVVAEYPIEVVHMMQYQPAEKR
jgi:hypothetical protein